MNMRASSTGGKTATVLEMAKGGESMATTHVPWALLVIPAPAATARNAQTRRANAALAFAIDLATKPPPQLPEAEGTQRCHPSLDLLSRAER